jgi:transposase-like protein
MSPRKLSDSDKRDILNLYREPEETTSTLAVRYNVSSSTISRLLKSRLVEQEYEALIQQKRSSRGQNTVDDEEADTDDLVEVESESGLEEATPEPERRVRKRLSSSAQETSPNLLPASFSLDEEETARREENFIAALNQDVESEATELELQPSNVPNSLATNNLELLQDNYRAEASVLKEMLGEDLADLDDEEQDDDDDLEDGDEEDWEDDLPDVDSHSGLKIIPRESRANVQVLPLSQASLPKICYLVVDRTAELIVRPLKEFSDLGKIPAEEVQQKTLPVFDNHRVARRFSNRAQRVIKVPDGKMLQKTCSQLQAKGITRLLIDGQVYSLLL